MHSPTSQWAITWESEAGGFVGRAGLYRTGAYTTFDAAHRAIERGDYAAPAATEGERSEQGLVSYQQSSLGDSNQEKHISIPAIRRPRWLYLPRFQAAAERAEERRKQQLAVAREAEQARRFLITVGNGGEVLTLDSQEMRLRRAQKRVHAWAEAIPMDKRKVRVGRNLIDVGPRLVMITLTYEAGKKWYSGHIGRFMKNIKRRLDRRLYGSAWVCEMQRRGVPHYHVLLWVKRGTRIPMPDKTRLWEHGSSRIETAKTPHYITKYVGKEYQKEALPKHARMAQPWLNKEAITEDALFLFRLSAVPAWLRPYLIELKGSQGFTPKWCRAKGGGWLIRDTGEVIPSPWVLICIEPLEGG